LTDINLISRFSSWARGKPKEPWIPRPKGLQGCVKSAVLDAIEPALFA